MIFGKTHYDENHKLVRYGPFRAIGDFFRFLLRFFAPDNIRHGFRSVISGFREYVVFFIALTVVQTAFCSVGFWACSRARAAEAEARAGCSYDLMFCDLTPDEWTEIYNRQFRAGDALPDDSQSQGEAFAAYTRGYDSYTVEEYVDAYGETRVQVKVLLGDPVPYDDIGGKAEAFMKRYSVRGADSYVKYSERMRYADRLSADRITAFFVCAGLSLLSVLILLILFLIRTNHYKFTYGIYMSFGADYEKLFTTAGWELMAAAVLTFLPSAGAAWLIRFLLARPDGPCALSGGWLIADFLWVLGVIMVAIIPSVRILAGKTPMSLIVAADNSNYVSSPRYSFRIFDKSFPIHYELFGFWRFRRYYALLLVSAVIFTSLFICGTFVSRMVNASDTKVRPQFTVNARGENIDTMDIESMADAEGVAYVTFDASVSATQVLSHAVLTKKQAAGISSMTVAAQQDGMKADNNFKYVPLSDLMLDTAMANGLWKVEGDLSAVMTEKNTVAVTREVNNESCMDFRVGDTITLARFSLWGAPVKTEKYDRKYVLNQQIEYAYFDFFEVRIGAVIDTGDVDDEYSVLLAPELFTEITGKEPVIREAFVYTEPDLGHDGCERVYGRCRELMSYYDFYEITDTGNDYAVILSRLSSADRTVLICAVLVLAVSPLVWFFSQATFCRKRGKETYMLSSFGATDTQLGRLYLFSGGVLTVLAVAAAVILGTFLNYSVYSLINYFMTSLGFNQDVRYDYSFSWAALLICVAVSAVSAMLATYLPFRKYCRDRDRIARMSTGEN